MASARRRLWLAGVLQLITPGLGHVYSGRPWRGLVFHAGALCLVVLIAVALTLPMGLLTLLVPVGGFLLGWAFLILDAVRCARACGPDYQLKRYNRWYIYLLLILAVGAVEGSFADIIRLHVKTFRYVDRAMQPTILAGDRLAVDMKAYTSAGPQRGDIVVFPSPDDPETIGLKRVVGLPGETLEIREKRVFINGQPLDEPYACFAAAEDLRGPMKPPDSLAPVVIPADEYFLLGDNRGRSRDSRSLGPFPRSQILGKARTIFFSWDSAKRRIRWERIGIALK